MLTDVSAVLVTVVPVATMVIGAGVIVVVLSTVAGGQGSAFCTLPSNQIWETTYWSMFG